MSARFTYNSEGEARPHVHPLRTPSGFTLTRNAPEDHPWHHALWFTIKFVNEENFWEERPKAEARRTGERLDAIAAGAIAGLTRARVASHNPWNEPAVGMCGWLDTYLPEGWTQ